MLIKIIQEKSEETLLSSLEKQRISASFGALLCAFKNTTLSLEVDAILLLLKSILHDLDAQLYFCDDGDLLILWRGRLNETRAELIHNFMQHYKQPLESFDQEALFIFYDTHVQGEDLRLLLRAKIKAKDAQKAPTPPTPPVPPVTKPAPPIALWKPELSAEQNQTLQMALVARKGRTAPEILIVEDQEFSRKLLASLFEKQFRYHTAKDAEQAVQLFALHAPDIAFLDVELPDIDGHRLASLIKQHDPHCCIVMVTGNNHARDVETAKANKVQGFIVKPYNKQKIMAAVDAFTSRKARTPLP